MAPHVGGDPRQQVEALRELADRNAEEQPALARRLQAIADALVAALDAVPPSAWQPIATATLENQVWSRVLVYAEGIVRIAIPSDTDAGRMWWCEGSRKYISPTHWKPLTPPDAEVARLRVGQQGEHEEEKTRPSGADNAEQGAGEQPLTRTVWEVWQGRTLVCSRTMKLTEREARNKVENERRLGYFMEARPVRER